RTRPKGHAASPATPCYVLYSLPFQNARPATAGHSYSETGHTMRPSGRTPEQPRDVRITRNYTRHAEGSVLVEFGDTKVICTASVENKVPPFLRGEGKGWITAEYGMLPRSTGSRMGREAARGKQGGRTVEIQRLIGRSLRDAGTRTDPLTGGCVAVVQALNRRVAPKRLKYPPLKQMVPAISVGAYKGTPVADLDYPEASEAEADMNVIMTDQGGFIEIQGTAEGAPFEQTELDAMLDLARKAINQLFEIQQEALEG